MKEQFGQNLAGVGRNPVGEQVARLDAASEAFGPIWKGYGVASAQTGL